MSAKSFNSSVCQVVRASSSEGVDSGLIPSRVKLMTLKLIFTASLLDAQHLKGQWGEAGMLLVVPLGKALSGILPLGVVDRWLATHKRARYSALIAFS